MKDRFIYALCCPITGEVHYVGKTINGMTRPLTHMKLSHSEKNNEWVNGLKVLGLSPSVKIIKFVSDIEDIDLEEKYAINNYIKSGCLLLNTNLVKPITILSELDSLLSDDPNPMGVISTFVKKKEGGIVG